METIVYSNKPLLKTKVFSTYHVEIFEQILLGKTNREINRTFGYSVKSHAVVDHSRKVMYKLLAYESLPKSAYLYRVNNPRKFLGWWKNVHDKNKSRLFASAKKPEFYSNLAIDEGSNLAVANG
jgi:hypothetical protein